MVPKADVRDQKAANYTVSDQDMAVGSTLGAPKVSLVIKATGAIEKIYSPEVGAEAFGTLVLHHWDAHSGVPLVARPGTFEIFPAHQRHFFRLSNGVDVRENIFLLSGAPEGEKFHDVDPPGAYYTLELHNEQDREVTIATYASVRLRGGMGGVTSTAYDKSKNFFVASNSKNPNLVRIAACSPSPDSYEVTLDSAKASAPQFPGPLSGQAVRSQDDPIGMFHFEHRLRANQKARVVFILTFSANGEEEARANLRALPDAEDALERTQAHYEQTMERAIVLTPDEQVNRGALWAKANILRTQSLTSQGWCFVNDPTRSNNSVGRDTAWYGFGADYLTPFFTKEALLWYLDHLEPSGMVVEYFDIRNGKSEDYGLNINDDTPLLILALWHHFCVTGNRQFLEDVYPRLHTVAAYIISQRDDRGLVWCKADGTADWGIAGWRNVIRGYRLSGATTEVNSECYAALRTMSIMAKEMGDENQAALYGSQADELKAAINEHLLDKTRNLYYLNIDLDGTARTDVTCDLVFPVMFGVADHEVAANIISRLSIPEFWSDAGMHTVPRNDINYGPTHGYGLLGGVWAGPTFWFAFAASAFNPEFMAYALSTSFKHYSQDPRRNNTVPGQFSEWLHGETLTNQGMMLSPWFAPKYLWSAIEGAAGLNVAENPPKLHPRLGSAWSWIAVRNAMVRGKAATWIAARMEQQCIFATYPFESVDAGCLYEEDVTGDMFVGGDTAVHVALATPEKVLAFIGNTLDRTVTISLRMRDGHLEGKKALRRYNTLRNEWIAGEQSEIDELRQGMPIQISREGFCVLELSE